MQCYLQEYRTGKDPLDHSLVMSRFKQFIPLVSTGLSDFLFSHLFHCY